MDPVRLGHSYRALRIRRKWRQADLSTAAGVTRGMVSLVERGRIDAVPVGALRRFAEALEADLDVRLSWRREGLDRLLDQAHAGLMDVVVELLQRNGWETAVEVSFSMWGERGSVDVLAVHSRARIVLVVEVKSVIPDSQATLHGLDRKTRLAPEIAKARGWTCSGVARLLVVGESSTSRRRIAALGSTYRVAFPISGWAVLRWLREPMDGMRGLLFLPYARAGVTGTRATGIQRVRKRGIQPKRCHVHGSDADGNNAGLGAR